MSQGTAPFQSYPAPTHIERRVSVRHLSGMEAMSRPLDVQDTISWGATVRDISAGGIGLMVCYPFRRGTYLAVDLLGTNGALRTLLTRVIHTEDLPDGTWLVGCEFVKPLTDSDLELMI